MAECGKEVLICFDSANCTQCHGCEIACKTWRSLTYGIQYRRVFNLWQGTYPQVKSASLSLACLHCVQPACAAACPEEAISKRQHDGLVLVDESLCSGCGVCVEACAFEVPLISEDGVMRKCDLCQNEHLAQSAPPCVETCPGGALTLVAVSPSEKTIYEKKIMRLLKSG